MMIRISLAALAIGGILAGTAFAETIVISPEQETVIRQYVATHTVAPVEVTGVEISVGATLPETVELHTLDVPDVAYRYVVIDGQTVLVDPGMRKIVHVLGN
jgi:hypothetical protein